MVVSFSIGEVAIAWLLMLIAGITDVLDGWLARRAGGGSKWGARYDPLADKILLALPMIWLVEEKILPFWAIWIVLSRETIISGWRSELISGGPASKQGKAKTIFQFLSLMLLVWPNSWGNDSLIIILNEVGLCFFWISLILSISSAIFYLKFQSKVDLK